MKKLKTMMLVLTIVCFLASQTQAWLRFGAKNCLAGCYRNSRGTNKYYCANGREMGWCCPDAKRYECRQNDALEMFCSYN